MELLRSVTGLAHAPGAKNKCVGYLSLKCIFSIKQSAPLFSLAWGISNLSTNSLRLHLNGCNFAAFLPHIVI